MGHEVMVESVRASMPSENWRERVPDFRSCIAETAGYAGKYSIDKLEGFNNCWCIFCRYTTTTTTTDLACKKGK